jgi:protein-disulfide isomerase
MTMNFFSRRTALAAISALALAACGESGTDTAAASDVTVAAGSELGHVKGNADAPVTLIEYASPTCPACKYWHDEISPVVQSDYIDTGKVKLIFREYPLHGPDVPAYLVAMCAGEDKYFDVLDELFEYQSGIIESAQNGVLKAMLQTIGQRHGIETEEQFDACMNNRGLREQMADIYQTAEAYGVTGTPTFVINGETQQFANMNSAEKVTAALDAALEAAGATAGE